MASTGSLTRLAFRPLSTRCQCRFASTGAPPTVTRTSSAGGLAGELLRSIEKNRQAPMNMERVARQAARANVERRGTLRSLEESNQRRLEKERETAAGQAFTKTELERLQGRKWMVGDVYAPHDLTGIEQKKWKTPIPIKRGKTDIFDQLGINPIREYKNFSLMAEFVTETGRIKPRKLTGLRPVNQRRIAKAIRRAMGCGLMPRTYKHPELLKRDRSMLRRARRV